MRLRTAGVFGLIFVLLLIIIAVTIRIVTLSLLSRDRVETTLAQAFGQEIRVQKTTFNFWSGIEISGVRVPMADKGYDFLKVRKIRISYDQLRLLRGKFVVEKITLLNPELYIIDNQFPQNKLGNAPKGQAATINIVDGSLIYSDRAILKPDRLFTVKDINVFFYPLTKERYIIEGFLNAGQFGKCELRADWDPNVTGFSANLIAHNTDIGEPLRDMLSAKYQHSWDRFKPKGKVNLSANFKAAPNLPFDFKLDLECQQNEMTFIEFPYPVAHIEGNLELTAQEVKVKNVKGASGLTSVTCNGTVDGYSASSGYTLMFLVDALPLDNRLYNALPAPTKKIWSELNPGGQANATCLVQRKSGENLPTSFHTKIYCQAAQIKLNAFPYTITDAAGEIEVFNHIIKIKSFSAQHEKATMKFEGDASTDTAGGLSEFSLSVSAKNIESNDFNLKESMEKVLPGSAKLWNDFQPSGLFDINLNLTKITDTNKIESAGTIQCNEVAVKIGKSFFPMEKIKGQIDFNTNHNQTHLLRVSLNHLSCTNNDTKFEFNGFAENPNLYKIDQPESKQNLALNIGITNLNLEQQDFYNIMPDGFRTLVRQANLKGNADILLQLNTKSDNPANGEPATGLDYAAEIKLLDCVSTLGINFSDITGNVTLKGFYLLSAETDSALNNHLAGSIKLSQLKLEGKLISNLSTTFTFENNRLNFYDIKGNSYKGSISGDFRATLPSEPVGGDETAVSDTTSTDVVQFQGKATLAGIDIKELGHDTKLGGKEISGKLAAEFDFSGKGTSKAALNIVGKANITDAQLWEVPVFLSIYNIFNMNDKTTFKEGEIKFMVEKGIMDIKRLNFISNSLNLRGKGTMKLEDGGLDIQFDAEFPKSMFNVIPLLNKLKELFMKGIFTIKVSGTFDNPKAELKPLPILDIFK